MWPGGVTFGVIGSSFFGNVSNCWLNSYDKFRYLRKTMGADNPPPGRAHCAVNIAILLADFTKPEMSKILTDLTCDVIRDPEVNKLCYP